MTLSASIHFLRRIRATGLPLALAIGAAAVAAACTEKLEGGAACPILCPGQSLTVHDTILEGQSFIALDTTLGEFPNRGQENFLLLTARAGLRTIGVVRFDSLPLTVPRTGGGEDSITALDSAVLRLSVIPRRARVSAPVTVQAFDVTDAGEDPGAATLASFFDGGRLLGAITVPADTFARDTLVLPLRLAPGPIVARIRARRGIRIALRVQSPAEATLLLTAGGLCRAPFPPSGAPAASLFLDPVATDTAVRRTILPSSGTPADNPDVACELADYTLTLDPVPFPSPELFAIGGFPSRRALLRFSLPRRLVDSTTIIRATLLLTQVANPAARPGDTVTVAPLIGIAALTVSDVGLEAAIAQRCVPFTGHCVGAPFAIPALPLFAGAAGLRALELGNLFTLFRSSPDTLVHRSIVLSARDEGSTPVELLFYSRDARDPAVRPRLRISYVERVNLELP